MKEFVGHVESYDGTFFLLCTTKPASFRKDVLKLKLKQTLKIRWHLDVNNRKKKYINDRLFGGQGPPHVR